MDGGALELKILSYASANVDNRTSKYFASFVLTFAWVCYK